jgi:hypothetical protein
MQRTKIEQGYNTNMSAPNVLDTNDVAHNFGNCFIGRESSAWTLILSNGTENTITVSSIALTGGDTGSFEITSGGSTPLVIPKNTSHNILLKCYPITLGGKSTSLRLIHSADNTPLDIPLYGNGVMSFDKTYVAAGGAVRITIDSTVDLSTSSLKTLGKIKVGYDNPDEVNQDEVIFYPSNVTLTFHDLDKSLYNDLRVNSRVVTIYKNGVQKFVGLVDIQSVSHPITTDQDRNTTTFTLLDNAHKIKDCVIADGNDSSENPFGYTNEQWVRVTRVLKDIFKVANPSVTLLHNQDWSFSETYGSGPYTFDQIYIPTATYFFDAGKPKAASDLLTLLCDAFGCVAGMVDNTTAYFLKRWKSSSTPTSLSGLVKKCTPESFLQKKLYVRVVDTFLNVNYDEPTVGFPTDFVFSDDTLKYPDDSFRIDLDIDAVAGNTNLACDTGTNDFIAPGTHQWVLSVIDPSIDNTYRALGRTVSLYHYNYLNVFREKVTLVLYGTEFPFISTYSYDSRTLRSISFEYDLFANETTAIFMDVT